MPRKRKTLRFEASSKGRPLQPVVIKGLDKGGVQAAKAASQVAGALAEVDRMRIIETDSGHVGSTRAFTSGWDEFQRRKAAAEAAKKRKKKGK